VRVFESDHADPAVQRQGLTLGVDLNRPQP